MSTTFSNINLLIIGLTLLAVLVSSIFYFQKQHVPTENVINFMSSSPIEPVASIVPLTTAQTILPPPSEQFINDQEESLLCEDPVWCNIPMPTKSYYKFDPPTDASRWKKAQIQASKGEQVLLKEVIKAFPNHFDFLDGDISFRKLHFLMDFFIDERRDLTPLTLRTMTDTADRRLLENGSMSSKLPEEEDLIKEIHQLEPKFDDEHRQLEQVPITSPKVVDGKLQYPWEATGKSAIPSPYNFLKAKRAPIVSIGYTAFTRDSQTYFTGNRIGGAFIDRKQFLNHWRKVKDRITTPFIAVCSLNENWGFLSTNFPNRTAGWGQCCEKTPHDRLIYDYLNHDKTLLLVTNQHTNISHPKLMVMPRGIPITWGFTRMLVWDTQRNVLQAQQKKEILLFSSSSKWGPRPQILACISKQFAVKDFEGHVDRTTPPTRIAREEYYWKLSTAMFGLGLPGLGYDCFRYVTILLLISFVFFFLIYLLLIVWSL